MQGSSQVMEGTGKDQILKPEVETFGNPGNTIGVQQNIRERLTERVEHLLKNSLPTDSIVQNKKIQVKLSGDGTNIGKRLHVVNVTFTILDEGSKAMSASGNHMIAIIKEPEDYDKLAKSLN